jgi:hypothetical protein
VGSLSTYLKEKLADWVGGSSMPAAPATIYFAAHVGDPTEAGSAHEVTDVGRVAVTTATGIDATAELDTNVADIDFPAATIDVGDVDYWSAWDAVSGGNCLFVDFLTDDAGDPLPVEILTGDVLRYPAGSIQITWD